MDKSSESELSVEEKIKQLRRKRAGKKGSITKRVEQLTRIVSEGGSRRKIEILQTALERVYKDTLAVCEELSTLTRDEADEGWIEDVSHNIDTCSAVVGDYLDARKDEAPSVSSIAESWVKRYSVDRDQDLYPVDDQMQELANGMADMSTHVSEQITSAGNLSQFNGLGGISPLPPPFTSWRHTPISLPTSGSIAECATAWSFQGEGLRPSDNPLLVSSTGAQVRFKPSEASRFPSYSTSFVQQPRSLSSAVVSQPWTTTSSQQIPLDTNMFSSNFTANLNQRHPPATIQDQNANLVDSWIDELDEVRCSQTLDAVNGISADVTMAWLVQQSLPRAQIPVYDGSPTGWVDFIVKFRDVIHNQRYLNDTQRCLYLMQHVKDEAKRAVKGYSNDARGYILSLKRLKFLFGQKSKIAQVTLRKVTQGKAIENDDASGLIEFYYMVSDCLVTLTMLNYESDLRSTDTLRQAVRRLPSKMHMKWAEYCLTIRRKGAEPTLLHFEPWLQTRVLALKESYLPDQYQGKKKKEPNHLVGSTLTRMTSSCSLCDGKHIFWKCDSYKAMTPLKRFDLVKKMKVCFNCLNASHNSAKCGSRNCCFVTGCKEKHHTTLHQYFTEKKEKIAKAEKEDKKAAHDAKVDEMPITEKGERKEEFQGMVKSPPKDIFLQVVPVTLRSPSGRTCSTYAFLDNGSCSTFLREDVAKKLELRGKNCTISITTIKDRAEQLKVQDVSLEVSAKDSSDHLSIESAYVVPLDKFNMPRQPRLDHSDDDIFTHLDGLELNAIDSDEITILIGANVPEALLATNVKRGRHNQPLAIQTKLGWTLFGKSSASHLPGVHHTQVSATYLDGRIDFAVRRLWGENRAKPVTVNAVQSSEDQLLQSVERFWKIEHNDISPGRETAMAKQDVVALKKLDSHTKMHHDRYEVPMLWKDPEIVLPNNYYLVRKRFEFLRKRLRADPEFYAKYKEVIDQYVQKGYARRMTKEEAANTGSKTWYLPHHPVLNPNKPGKVRVVKDAAAECEGISLNKALITGPDLLNSLNGVLVRFRNGEFAIAADVEAMFHQVRVPEADADALRFLWVDDIFSDDEPYSMQMLVHIFGATDSQTCSAYALQRCGRDNYEDFDGLTFETLLKSFYVDDLLKGLSSEERAVSLALELIDMLKRGGFRLTKFVSNSKTVLQALPPSEVSKTVTFDLESEKLERALGICWNTARDTFTFRSSLKETSLTKRGILSTTSSLFDPLGFINPFILKAKILLQELWRGNCGWDEEIPPDAASFWKKWLDGAKNVCQIEIPRCYVNYRQSLSSVELHVFCDASEAAYGSVCYLRFSFKDGSHACRFVMAKSKLAPIKSLTLPRLELNGAVTAVRLFSSIICEIDLPIERPYFWTDSMLTIQYILNETRRFKAFVANRVREILDTTSPDQWRHVPGNINPADIATRGVIDPTMLLQPDKHGTSWFNGPTFLDEPVEDWPNSPIDTLDDENPEIKRKAILVALGIVNQSLINSSRFSNWLRLRRAIGWMLRFLYNCRNENKRQDEELSLQEVEAAEIFVIKDMQASVFSAELKALRCNSSLANSNVLSSLCPYIDSDGLLRVGGRLRLASVPYNTKHPYILPKDNAITDLIVRLEHVRNGHVGSEHVLSDLRQYCWVIHGRTVLKRIIRKCFFCQIRKAKRKYPFMADLPTARLSYEEPPFTKCGVDLFGPIYIKQGRKRLKRWGVLFTCMTVRCIHLEMVESMNTDEFINSLRRFVNRRGSPDEFFSDCGSNFKGATKEVVEFHEKMDLKKIKSVVNNINIKWTFNPPSAPHMGGAWERLVRSVKDVMSGLVKDHILTDSQFSTLLTEVENIINSRPLTHLSDDVTDLNPLTPNHILLGKYRNWNYVCQTDENDTSSRRKWRQVQGISNIFWTRWKREYMPELTKRPCWRDHIPNFKVDELVLLNDGESRRGKWPLARITKTMPGKDDVVRVVELRTKDGIYVRPVTKLYRLEDNDDQVP